MGTGQTQNHYTHFLDCDWTCLALRPVGNRYSCSDEPCLLILREGGFHRGPHIISNFEPEEWMVFLCLYVCCMSMNVQWDHCWAAAALLSSPWDSRDVVCFSLFKRSAELRSNEEGHSFWVKRFLLLKMNPIHEEIILWDLFSFTEVLWKSICPRPDFFSLSHWSV